MQAQRQHCLLSIVAISAAFGYLNAGSQAHAQSAEAEGLFNDGNELMAEGNLAPACSAFEASNRAEPRAGTLIRLGDCRAQNHQLASAWSAYKDALTRVRDPEKRAYAAARAEALEPRISHLTVSVPAESRIHGLTITRDGTPLDPLLWNHELSVDGGDYVIAAHAAGREQWHTTAHVAVEGARITIDVPRLKELRAPASPPAAVAAAPAAVAEPPAAVAAAPAPTAEPPVAVAEPPDGDELPPTSRFPVRRKVAIGVAGASVAALITGAVLGVSARGRQDDAFRQCSASAPSCANAHQANALLTTSHSRALEANVAFGIAAAAAIGAGVLWLTGAPDHTTSTHLGVAPSTDSGATLFFEGRF